MKRILIITLTIILILLAPLSTVAAEETNYDAITEVYELLKSDHLSNIDDESLQQGAIRGMIEALGDPHTRYFTDEEYKRYIEDLDGDFVGIGIYISEKHNYIEVQSVIKGSPAEAAGLQALDLITSVNGTDIYGKSNEETSALIRGVAGTTVTLTIKRGEQLLDFTLKRAQIHIPAVTSEMLADKTGYLEVNSFSSTLADEAAAELEALEEQGMKQLIIDLRNNPGGYLNAALSLSGLFIEEGPIVYVRDNSGRENAYTISKGNDWTLPTVILINSGSASASEIFAGAMSEYGKATIIGQQSYGKGTVQHLLRLTNGGHLKLTVNEYFTSKKAKVDGVGITPDILVTDNDKQLAFARMYLNALASTANKLTPVFTTALPNLSGEASSAVALRALSNSLGGEIAWDGARRVVSLRYAGVRYEFNEQDNALVIQDGVSYLPLDQLNKLIPSLIAVQEGGKIKVYRR